MDRFVYLVEGLVDAGLWAESFGLDCPDGVGDPAKPPDVQIEDMLGHHIGIEETWPLRRSEPNWSRDDFYDLVEVLHDVASMPSTWSSHHYGGCVGHAGGFSPAVGQALYRDRVNALLGRSDLGVRLADSGEDQGRLVLVSGGGLDEALVEAVAVTPAEHVDEVRHAVALFRARDRDPVSMRSAIVTLAGVMERHRAMLHAELFSGDENALFEIANKFGLRHRKPDQRTDYDTPFLEWIFHWYLATVALLGHLTEERQAETGIGTPPRIAEEPF
jgi:hypothetical protein